MVRDGKWRGRESQSRRKRGGKKKLHSGLPAVVLSLPTSIRFSCFVVFSSSSSAPPSAPPLSISLPVRDSYADQSCTNTTCHLGNKIFFFHFLKNIFFNKFAHIFCTNWLNFILAFQDFLFLWQRIWKLFLHSPSLVLLVQHLHSSSCHSTSCVLVQVLHSCLFGSSFSDFFPLCCFSWTFFFFLLIFPIFFFCVFLYSQQYFITSLAQLFLSFSVIDGVNLSWKSEMVNNSCFF